MPSLFRRPISLGALLLAVVGGALRPGDAPAAELELATFSADLTPPLGEGGCLGFMPRIDSIEHPLEGRGLVLRSGPQTWVLVALDYQGLCNSSDDLFRARLAEAVGTTSDCVAVQSLHQHTAPVLDADAARLLHPADSPLLAAHLELQDRMSARLAAAAAAAAKRMQPVAHVVGTAARVERVASNRRVPLADGSLVVRGSATRDPALQAADEGLIDPWLRTVTFLCDGQAAAQLHYYATHPQSFYGDARVSWDVPGLARAALERETGVFQIYFTGCGGNVGMGKYNTGTREDRAALVERLLAAMRSAAAQGRGEAARDAAAGTLPVRVDVAALPEDALAWRTAELRFTPRAEPEFSPALLHAQLAEEQPLSTRIRAASYLAWQARLVAGHACTVSCVRIGPLRLMHLPGEPFVEYQLLAQRQTEGAFVCTAGYGECGVWYFGPDSIYDARGGYEQSWAFTGPCERAVEEALGAVLR